MTEKDLKKLTRYQLLELLVMQTARADELQKQLEEAQQKLDSREIQMTVVGSIAEASVQMGGLLEAAQNTVELYLNASKKHIEQVEAAAAEKAEQIVARARLEARRILEEAETKNT